MWNLKDDTNYLQKRNKLTDFKNKLMLTQGEMLGEE